MKRILGRISFAFFGVAVFIVALGLGFVVHLRLAVTRALLVEQVDRVLAGSFAGRARIGRVESIGLRGLRVNRVEVDDPDGVRVLTASNVHVTLSTVGLARAEMLGDQIVIDGVDVDDADVLVDESGDRLRLAHAFAPKHPSVTNEPSTLVLSIHDIALSHAWVHGRAEDQIVDVDVDHAGASVDVVRSALAINLRGAGVTARAMPRNANPRGHVAARLTLDAQTHAFATFLGHVGGVPLHAAGRVDGEAFLARATVPETTPADLHSVAPEVPLFEDVSLDAEAEGQSTAFVFHARGNVGPGAVDASGRVSHGAIAARAFARHVDLRAFSPSVGKSDLAADVAADVRDGVTRARGHVDAPGGHVVLRAAVDERVVDAEATGSLSNARSALAPVLKGAKLDGHGAFHARATLDRDTHDIIASTWARFEDVATGDVSAGVLQLDAHATGAMSDPEIGASVYAERTIIPHVSVKAARVRATGRLHDADVTARVAANGPFDLHARVRSSPGAIALEDLDVRSSGQSILRGDADWARDRVHARLAGHAIDLAQVKDTLGVDVPLAGTVALDVDATATKTDVEGRITLDARRLAWDRWHDIDARVDAAAVGDWFSLVSRARMTNVGWIAIDSVDLQPNGSPLVLESWRRATGSVHIDASGDIAAATHLVDEDATPATGFARVAFVARRSAPNEAPDVTLDVTTQKLAVTKKAYEVDVAAHIHVDHVGAIALRASASSGHVTLGATASAKADWNDVLTGRLPDFATLPFTADLDVPATDAAATCKALGVFCRGDVAMTAHLDGPIEHARAKIAARLSGFRSSASPFDGPVDATLDGTFDRTAGVAALRILQNGAPALDAKLDVRIPGDPSSWYASLDAKLADLAVRAPPYFSDDDIRARMSGTAKITNLHKDARARLDIDATKIAIGGVHDDRGKIAGGYDGQKLELVAHLSGAGESADIHANAFARWGAALAPALDETQPATVALKAAGFRLCTLAPFIPATLGDVDGRLDADTTGTIAVSPARVALKGWAKISDGQVESSSLGAMHDIQAKLVAQPDGSLSLENAHFRGTRGLVNVTGHAHATRGLVDEIKIGATIARDDAFPLVVSGQAMGDAWGRLDINVTPKNEGFAVAVDVPSLHVTLPDVSPRALQELGAAPNVSIGVRARGEIVPVALAPPQRPKRGALPVTIAIHLGNDVQLVRGDMLKMTLTGHPVVHIGDETTMSGSIRLVRGTLDVQGKRFEIERGLVTFVSEPSNPNLDVVAGWNAPDGSHVTAQYLGAVKDGRLVLSSDPPHTQDEIVALLVFGSANGPTPSTGASGENIAAKAISTGASFATQPFNKALEQLTHVDIKVRIDTSSTAAKSEVEVQIAKNISAQVAYVIGIPPPGADPDLTWLTLAWHATAHWSFDFTIGDHGSTIVDSMWHLRY